MPVGIVAKAKYKKNGCDGVNGSFVIRYRAYVKRFNPPSGSELKYLCILNVYQSDNDSIDQDSQSDIVIILQVSLPLRWLKASHRMVTFILCEPFL